MDPVEASAEEFVEEHINTDRDVEVAVFGLSGDLHGDECDDCGQSLDGIEDYSYFHIGYCKRCGALKRLAALKDRIGTLRVPENGCYRTGCTKHSSF